MRRRVAIFAVIVTALAAIFAIRPIKNFLDADACLDRGGAWEKQTSTCIGTLETNRQSH